MNTSLFAAVGAEEVATVAAKTTTETSTAVNASSPSQYEGYTVGDVEALVSNNATHATSENDLGGVKGLTVSYNKFVPFFGKTIAKDKSGSILGELTVTYQGKKIAFKTAKVVYLKTVSQKGGAFPTVSNATIQIKLDNKALKSVVTDKATQKAIKKAFKDKTVKGSKKGVGKLSIVVYPYRLNGAKKGAVSLKGKGSKIEKAKLILGEFGKKYTVKSGKDLFGKDASKAFKFTDDKKGLIVSTNEVWSGLEGTSANSVSLDMLDTNKFKADK